MHCSWKQDRIKEIALPRYSMSKHFVWNLLMLGLYKLCIVVTENHTSTIGHIGKYDDDHLKQKQKNKPGSENRSSELK